MFLFNVFSGLIICVYYHFIFSVTVYILNIMCGVFGVFLSNENINAYQYILNGITVLQHRGQDSAGIYTCKNKRVYGYKNIGKVSEVFKKDKSSLLVGNYGIGHIRYSRQVI